HEQAWLDLISQYLEVLRSELAASVTATVTVVVGERDGFMPRDLLESVCPYLAKRSHLHELISLRFNSWPRPLSQLFAEWDSQRADLQVHRRELDRLLEGTMNPAGFPAYAFYRDIVIPEVRRIYSNSGLDALCELDVELVEKLMRAHEKMFNR